MVNRVERGVLPRRGLHRVGQRESHRQRNLRGKGFARSSAPPSGDYKFPLSACSRSIDSKMTVSLASPYVVTSWSTLPS
jgi:hypothetical protein